MFISPGTIMEVSLFYSQKGGYISFDSNPLTGEYGAISSVGPVIV